MSATRRPVEHWVDDVLSPDSGLSPTDRLVAVGLSRYMDWTGLGNARPGTTRLSAETGYDIRTVQRALARLQESGWIEQTSKGRTTAQGVKLASIYRGIPRSERDATQGRVPGEPPAHDPESLADDPVTPGTGSENPRHTAAVPSHDPVKDRGHDLASRAAARSRGSRRPARRAKESDTRPSAESGAVVYDRTGDGGLVRRQGVSR